MYGRGQQPGTGARGAGLESVKLNHSAACMVQLVLTFYTSAAVLPVPTDIR